MATSVTTWTRTLQLHRDSSLVVTVIRAPRRGTRLYIRGRDPDPLGVGIRADEWLAATRFLHCVLAGEVASDA